MSDFVYNFGGKKLFSATTVERLLNELRRNYLRRRDACTRTAEAHGDAIPDTRTPESYLEHSAGAAIGEARADTWKQAADELARAAEELKLELTDDDEPEAVPPPPA